MLNKIFSIQFKVAFHYYYLHLNTIQIIEMFNTNILSSHIKTNIFLQCELNYFFFLQCELNFFQWKRALLFWTSCFTTISLFASPKLPLSPLKLTPQIYRQTPILFIDHLNHFQSPNANMATFIVIRHPVTILVTAFTKTEIQHQLHKLSADHLPMNVETLVH